MLGQVQEKEGRIAAVRQPPCPHPTTTKKQMLSRCDGDDQRSRLVAGRRDNSKLNARSKWSVILVVILISWHGWIPLPSLIFLKPDPPPPHAQLLSLLPSSFSYPFNGTTIAAQPTPSTPTLLISALRFTQRQPPSHQTGPTINAASHSLLSLLLLAALHT